MSIALILLGIFLLFALLFNGSVGETFVNYSFFASALLMVIAGSVRISNVGCKYVRVLCVLALSLYAPMIWQRFNFKFGTGSGGLFFDISIVVFLLAVIASKPNQSLKSGTPQSGAP